MNKEKKTILVIDDEVDVRDILLLILGNEYEVLSASSAKEALNILESGREIALIVSDVRMPIMSGVDFLKSLHDKFPSLPVVVFLSGYSDVSREEVFHLGAKAYLTKPLSRTELRMTIENILKDFPKYHTTGLQKNDLQMIKEEYLSVEDAQSKRCFVVGTGGFLIEAMTSADVGKLIHFEVNFKEGMTHQIQGIGKVMWKREVNGKKTMGIQFVELPSSTELFISDYVRKINQKSFIPKE